MKQRLGDPIHPRTSRYHSNKDWEIPFKQRLEGTSVSKWEVLISKDWKAPFK